MYQKEKIRSPTEFKKNEMRGLDYSQYLSPKSNTGIKIYKNNLQDI